jgi:hypothetical protein
MVKLLMQGVSLSKGSRPHHNCGPDERQAMETPPILSAYPKQPLAVPETRSLQYARDSKRLLRTLDSSWKKLADGYCETCR